ncbi:MAG TPA: hypothetical protein PKX87_05275 [Alphaproteobacteria bacterium]|nr:hypothetical protein [Alphaproteobacteria bacterium]
MADPMQDMVQQMAFLTAYPALVQNRGPLEQLGASLTPDDKANLGKVGLNLDNPLSSSPQSLKYLNGVLAQNPDGVQTLIQMPPHLRSEAFRLCAEKGPKGIVDLGALATGKAPGPAPARAAQAAAPAPNSAQTPATPPAASPSAPPPPASTTAQAATPPAADTPQTQAGSGAQTPGAQGGANVLQQLAQSNPQMAGLMNRMTEMMQGLMGKIMTGLVAFIGKIFGGMDGSGGSLFAASNNPASNNLGNALALGGADQNARVSHQVGDASPQETTVGALQLRGPTSGAPTPPPAYDPSNRLALNGPQMEPGRA